MSGDLVALATKWGTLGAGSTLTKLTALNKATVGQTQDIGVDVINQYLMNKGRIAGLAAFVNNTPSSPLGSSLLACNYLWAAIYGADGGMLKAASDPGLLTILSHLTDDARTGITAADLTALTAATSIQIPWWQANGFSAAITLADLIAAGNLT